MNQPPQIFKKIAAMTTAELVNVVGSVVLSL
jgi:hypothetical protein